MGLKKCSNVEAWLGNTHRSKRAERIQRSREATPAEGGAVATKAAESEAAGRVVIDADEVSSMA